MATKTYPYDIPVDYTYDSNKIEIAEGIVRLKENLIGVAGRWHLDEVSGINVPDSSGLGYNGTTINMEDADWQAGKMGNCLRFDGVNEYVNFGLIVGNFDWTNTFSLECWFKTTSTAIRYLIKHLKDATYRGYCLLIDSTYITFILATASPKYIQVRGNTAVNDNNWHHVVVTYDGLGLASGVKIYLDNNLETLTIIKDTLNGTTLVSEPFTISAPINSFDGWIDEVDIYNKVLTVADVSYRWNGGAGKTSWKYFTDKPIIEPNVLFDPIAVTIWNGFVELVTAGHQGTIGYNLYKVDKTNKYYWNGSAWIIGGSSNNYNSASIINDNINSFDLTPDKIGFIAYLISDGEQAIELNENQILYSITQAPIINAGSNKYCYDEDTLVPFSDCIFSDPDGTIDHAYYKIDGEVDIWTEILQGAYSTLLEAVQAFTYTFHNTGFKIVRLEVEDNEASTSEDSLNIIVNKYTVIFNITDYLTGTHLTNLQFTSGDGSSAQNKNSPFTFDYEKDIFNILFQKSGFLDKDEVINVSTNGLIFNYEMGRPMSQADIGLIADKVWEELGSEHTNIGSFGLIVQKILGLSQENYRIFSPIYDSNGNMTTATIKIYPSASDCEADTNVTATYTVTSTYDNNHRMATYKVKKI